MATQTNDLTAAEASEAYWTSGRLALVLAVTLGVSLVIIYILASVIGE